MAQSNKVASETFSPEQAAAAKESTRKIDAVIAKVRKSFESGRDDVQTAIVMIARHASGVGRGDVSRYSMLLDAMPQFVKRAGLINHVNKWTSIRCRHDQKTGKFTAYLAVETDDDGNSTGRRLHVTAEMVEALEANEWWKDERSRDTPNEFNLVDALTKVDNVINFIDRRLKNNRRNPKTGEDEGPFVSDAAERERLRDLANTLRGAAKRFAPDEIAKRELDKPTERAGNQVMIDPTTDDNVRTGTDG